MRKYKRDILLFLGIVAAYSLIAGVHKFSKAPKPSIYPVFAWDLFVHVPNITTEYRLYLERQDEKIYSPPFNLQQIMKPFRRQDPSNFFAIPQQINENINRNDEADINRLNSLLRARYFAGVTNLRYHLYKASYDPLIRWRDRNAETLTLVRTFNFTKDRNE